MSNLTRLQAVSSSLDTAIDKASNLPEVENLNSVVAEQQALITELSAVLDSKAAGGSGASVETCMLTLKKQGRLFDGTVYYTDGNLVKTVFTLSGSATSATITVAKNTIIFAIEGTSVDITGGYEKLGGGQGYSYSIGFITGDAELNFNAIDVNPT